MDKTNKTLEMFTFKTSLHFHRHAISNKTGMATIYLRVYISSYGQHEETYFNLNLKWPHELVDREACTLLPQFRGDTTVTDYNMIIMQHRSKINDIAVMYRLAGKYLSGKDLQRELIFRDSNKSFYAYFEKRRRELYNKREISEQTYKNYGGTIRRIYEFQPDVRFDQITVKWMQSFKSHLQKIGNSHNTVWVRIKDIKAMLRIANEEVSIRVDQDAINFPNKYISTPVTFLNRIELQKLLELLRAGYLWQQDENVLKAILFSCFPSLRISDI